jgi:hypothetical protein
VKRIIIIVWSILLIAAVAFFILPRTLLKPKVVHFHAGFQVYKDDKLVDFSDYKYMHEKPCTVNGKAVEDHDDEQIEKAHLHDLVGDVVHVHREGATWSDLFKNIKYTFDDNQATVYTNGQSTPHIFNQQIKSYDSVVIFIGRHTDDKKYLAKAVKKAHIQDIEKRSENCASPTK